MLRSNTDSEKRLFVDKIFEVMELEELIKVLIKPYKRLK